MRKRQNQNLNKVFLAATVFLSSCSAGETDIHAGNTYLRDGEFVHEYKIHSKEPDYFNGFDRTIGDSLETKISYQIATEAGDELKNTSNVLGYSWKKKDGENAYPHSWRLETRDKKLAVKLCGPLSITRDQENKICSQKIFYQTSARVEEITESGNILNFPQGFQGQKKPCSIDLAMLVGYPSTDLGGRYERFNSEVHSARFEVAYRPSQLAYIIDYGVRDLDIYEVSCNSSRKVMSLFDLPEMDGIKEPELIWKLSILDVVFDQSKKTASILLRWDDKIDNEYVRRLGVISEGDTRLTILDKSWENGHPSAFWMGNPNRVLDGIESRVVGSNINHEYSIINLEDKSRKVIKATFSTKLQ